MFSVHWTVSETILIKVKDCFAVLLAGEAESYSQITLNNLPIS